MRSPWFRPWGLLFYPVTALAWLACLLTLAFCVHVFLFTDAHAHSASDTLYGIFPYVVPALLCLYVLAMRTSDGSAPRR